MQDPDGLKHLPEFISKIEQEGLPPVVANTFRYYYQKIVTGETGLICDRDIEPVAPDRIESAENLADSEKKRKALNEKYDKLKLREKTDFVIDRSEKLLIQQGKSAEGDYTIAKSPPEIKMMILPDMAPEYFPEGEAYMVAWANWAHMTRSEDNRFFFSVGDHRGFGCQINLYEYSPARDIVHKVLDVDELLGWTRYSYTDGKIHGYMGIMPDGTLWGATHFGVYPDSSWFANGYRGSWLFSYNIFTHEAKNWGVPLVGQNLPNFSLNPQSGMLFGTGSISGTVLCWDCINKKVCYAGYPFLVLIAEHIVDDAVFRSYLVPEGKSD